MKRCLIILAVILFSRNMEARISPKTGKEAPIPVRHWEFDYFNYGTLAGSQSVYLFFATALRYNFDNLPVDVGGEISIGATPHPYYDPMELNEGDVFTRMYVMVSPAAHYNFRGGKNVSYYLGLGIGAGVGITNYFESCHTGPEDVIVEEWKRDRHFVASLTPRVGVELFRHVRVGLLARVPTDGDVTIGPSISVVLGGGKRR